MCSRFETDYLGSARTGLGAIRGYFKWRQSTKVMSLRTARLAASFSAMMVSIFGDTLFSSTLKTYSGHRGKCQTQESGGESEKTYKQHGRNEEARPPPTSMVFRSP